MRKMINKLKVWLENVAIPLNIIANFIMQSQIPKLCILFSENNVFNPAINHENNQSKVLIQTIEVYHKVIDKHPLEIFLRN